MAVQARVEGGSIVSGQGVCGGGGWGAAAIAVFQSSAG